MLTQIHIRDLATIEKIDLTFLAGTTMITGETGAGKSIFIEAIELALGGRASHRMVRAGKEKADVALSFDISHFPQVIAHLQELDLYQDQAECIIRRVITADNRSRCYVNGSPVTLQLTKELGELLFHLHGQHEQQVLTRPDKQRDMLDRYGNLTPLASEVKAAAVHWRTLEQTIQTLTHAQQERDMRREFLQFQVNELNTINVQAGEWETLVAAQHQLSHQEECLQALQIASLALGQDDEKNCLTSLNQIRKSIDAVASINPECSKWLETVDACQIQLQELDDEILHHIENIGGENCGLDELEQRMSQIFTLARKHKVAPENLHQLHASLALALSDDQSAADELKKLELEKAKAAADYQKVAGTLSQARQIAAEKFANEITLSMRELSLPHCEFRINLEKELHTISQHGLEKINFLIKTNPDQSLQAIAKVISGGELSRLSLAAHLALAHQTAVPTLVFDEIDTGLSGATAEKIGKLLRKLGRSYQVFVITHQPQVAAYGHHHLLVEKYFIAPSTFTRLRLLESGDKSREIARMLGGEKITAKTLAHAQEVLLKIE